ncbi:discoidin domain-containing protein [Helicobacter pullorum]|uniref:discoidin domain-containing protein n=1 Tax=Helicobacter pullorum TaxID=35818 RepID=UPI000CF02244|nr:discoidin domain-containing protein [Helicobacter pullorum]
MYFNEKEPSMAWKEEDLIELAKGKKAFQSSISKWSKFDDPQRPIDDSLNIDDYAFHTGKEKDPWWMVDLEDEYRIECIKIKNRKNCQEILKPIKIFYSLDKIEWCYIDQNLYEWHNLDEVLIPLNSFIKARYIKVVLEGIGYLHFKKIEIFKRKYPGLIVATRYDGFGGRINAMLNAMYIAQKTGMKFGFVWNKRELSPVNEVFVDAQEEIFGREFLVKHSYTDRVKHSYLPCNYKGTLSDFAQAKHYNANFGFYWPYHRPHEMCRIFELDIDDYKKQCLQNAHLIEWNPKICAIKDLVNQITKGIGSFEVIHLRNGDAVSVFKESIFWGVVMSRVFPFEVALHYIDNAKNNNKKIFLLGPDDLPRELKCAREEVYLTDEFTEKLNTQEKTMFDLFLMMQADRVITAATSTYAECANLMSGVELVSFENDLSKEERINLFYKYHQSARELISPLFLASSCAFWALDMENSEEFDKEEMFLSMAFDYDANYAYKIRLLYILIKQRKYEQCEMELENFSECDYQNLLKSLLSQPIWSRDVNRNIIALFLSSAIENFPYISYLAAKISYYPATTSLFQKNPSNALKFIQYSLKSQPNNKEFLSCKKEIEALLTKQEEGIAQSNKSQSNSQQPEAKANDKESQIAKISPDSFEKQLDSKTQELTQIKNQLNSKIKELNFTLRYGTAKSRIHNHLSYKLGQAMIENSKSLLGYIRMPYVLSYIKDKHKQEQQQYQEAIKKNPNLKLPTLESYPDYKESLKEKECITYKLGEAFIKASKTWYKGGYVKLWFEVGRLKERFKQ